MIPQISNLLESRLVESNLKPNPIETCSVNKNQIKDLPIPAQPNKAKSLNGCFDSNQFSIKPFANGFDFKLSAKLGDFALF